MEFAPTAPYISDRLKDIAFDFKQKSQLLCDPIQPSSFYYHSKRNVHLFGVITEFEKKKQQNIFIYDEVDGNKTSNLIITMLYYLLKLINLKPTGPLVMYMDNCPG